MRSWMKFENHIMLKVMMSILLNFSWEYQMFFHAGRIWRHLMCCFCAISSQNVGCEHIAQVVSAVKSFGAGVVSGRASSKKTKKPYQICRAILCGGDPPLRIRQPKAALIAWLFEETHKFTYFSYPLLCFTLLQISTKEKLKGSVCSVCIVLHEPDKLLLAGQTKLFAVKS